jgi:hypothetical protein
MTAVTSVLTFGCTSVSASARSRLAVADELLNDEVGRFVRTHRGRIDAQFSIFGRLVRAVDAGEILELAGARLGVEAFDVALFGFGERRIDEDLEELAFRDHLPHHLSLRPERRDKGREDDQARI